MAQYAVKLQNKRGCLDSLVESLDSAQVTSFACACSAEATTTTFSLAEEGGADMLKSIGATGVNAAVIHLKVANRAGCLSEALLPLSRAGVEFQSVACACAPGDRAGTVSIALKAQK